MIKYSLENIEAHWTSILAEFDADYGDCRAVFESILLCSTPVANALAHRKSLEPNCAFLLLAKSLNHALATLVLLQRGLIVDAALTSRNGLETLLLLELLSKQPVLCERWAEEDAFRPGEVRRLLAQLPSVTIGDLVIEMEPRDYDDVKFVYDWFSRITHANLESLRHSSIETGSNEFSVHIGGSLSRPQINAITVTLGMYFHRALLICSVAHAPALLESQKSLFSLLKQRCNSVDMPKE